MGRRNGKSRALAFGLVVLAYVACAPSTFESPSGGAEGTDAGEGADAWSPVDSGPSAVGEACRGADECQAKALCDQVFDCVDGACVEVQPPCTDTTPDDCVTLACVSGQCLQFDLRDGTACDDGNACTVDDACRGGECVGAPKSPACLPGQVCNRGTGACECADATPVPCPTGCFAQCCPGAETTMPCSPCGRRVCAVNGTFICRPDPGGNCTGTGDCSQDCGGAGSRVCQAHRDGLGNTNPFVCACSGCF